MKKKVTMNCIMKFEGGEMSIRSNQDGLASLTDIWKKAGSPSGKRPAAWLLTNDAIEFVEHIQNLKGKESSLLETTHGRGGGTYADIQIGLKYAQYLSPELQHRVNDVFIERVQEDLNPSLALERGVDRATEGYTRQGKDRDWIARRINGIVKRKDLTSDLKARGVEQWGFGACTNAIYRPTLGGSADQVKAMKGLPAKANVRDNLTSHELTVIAFAEDLARLKMDQDRARGNHQCQNACTKAAVCTREAIDKALA